MKRNSLTHGLSGALLASFLLLATASCDHKELCTDHFHNTDIQVIFDWTKSPGAEPESMRLYLYPLSGGKPLIYEFSDYRGGSVNIPAGNYKAICVNSDTETVLYRNTDSYDTFEAYAATGSLETRSASLPRAEGTETERVALSSDPLYTDCLDGVTILALTEGQTMTLDPEAAMRRYRLTIGGVSNLQYLSSGTLTGTLSGMSGGLLVSKGVTTAERVTVPFTLTSDGESTLTADFLAFSGTKKESGDGTGGEETTPETHKMTVYAVMSDGSKNYYTFDVTLAADGEEGGEGDDDSGGISGKIDGLPLPKPIVNGGGFHPAMDGWRNIEVDIPM